MGYYNTPDFIQEPFELSTDEDLSNQLMIKYDVKEGLSFSPIGGVYKHKAKTVQLWCIVKNFIHIPALLIQIEYLFCLKWSEFKKNYKNFLSLLRFIESFKRLGELLSDWEFIEGDTLEVCKAEIIR